MKDRQGDESAQTIIPHVGEVVIVLLVEFELTPSHSSQGSALRAHIIVVSRAVMQGLVATKPMPVGSGVVTVLQD